MNTRIHSFKVYLVETVSGMSYWTFRKPTEEDIVDYKDTILQTETLWDLLYLVRDGKKKANGKSLVRKSDLEYLLKELSATGQFDKIAAANK